MTMNVLWITNIILPPVCSKLSLPIPNTGGWMLSSANCLKEAEGIELAVASVYGGKEIYQADIDGIRYYLLPNKGSAYNSDLEPLWVKIKEDFRPDVVHIHGTEFPYGLAYIRACGSENVVCSIQGLVSACAYYYYGGISLEQIKKCRSLYDFRTGGIIKGKNDFEKKGEYEVECIKAIKHVIGRTSWDHDHCWAINPCCKYHFCNETLRPAFYNAEWKYENCNKHSIFVSQAGYPLKGFHKLLEALPFILRHYPDTTVRVAGTNMIDQSSWKKRVTKSGYTNYLLYLINKNNLQGVVKFTGSLNENQMVLELLNANVSVCPSAIENSPNSLGEAQLLGVPVVASYVGGIPDMMLGDEEHMYRFEDLEMLAYKVCKIFEGKDMVETSRMRKMAFERHDPKTNVTRLLNIYHNL